MNWRQIFFIVFMCVYISVSGGTVVYNHFCAMEQCEVNEKASLTKHHCQSMSQEKSHCAETTSNKQSPTSDCCDDEAKLKTFDQIKPELQDYLPIVLFSVIRFIPSTLSNHTIDFRSESERFILIPKTRIHLLYQQMIC